jgi:hypothetical protein
MTVGVLHGEHGGVSKRKAPASEAAATQGVAMFLALACPWCLPEEL